MEYQALYRQFRPELFSDMVGQEHIVQALTNQVESGKVAHAYLFCGTRGTGKTTTARILSRAVNCENKKGAEPCNECEACRGILNGSAIDVVEIDAASNTSVDNIRQIRDEIAYPPTMLRYKVYIIDEVHMLSTGAFNALLKTLEEPPEHVIFILATTEYHKIPATILSRCQRFDFRRISSAEIQERLRFVAKESNFEIDDESCSLISYAADGSMRDALSILDKCISFTGDKIDGKTVTKILGIVDDSAMFELSRAISEHNVEKVITIAESAVRDGRDPILLTSYLIEHFRCLLVASYVKDVQEVLQMSLERAERFVEYSKDFSGGQIIKIVKSLSNLYKLQKESPNPKVMLEIGLVTVTDSFDSVQEPKARPMQNFTRPEFVKPEFTRPQPPKPVPAEVKAEPVKTEASVEKEPASVEIKPADTSAAPTPAPANEGNNSDIVSLWHEIVDELRRSRPMLGTSVSFAFPYEKNGVLEVVYRKDKTTVKNMVNNAENAKEVERAVYEISGKNVKVKFKTEDEVSSEVEIPEVDVKAKFEELAGKFPDIVSVEED